MQGNCWQLTIKLKQISSRYSPRDGVGILELILITHEAITSSDPPR